MSALPCVSLKTNTIWPVVGGASCRTLFANFHERFASGIGNSKLRVDESVVAIVFHLLVL